MKLEDQIAVMQAFKGTPICEVFDNPGEDEGDANGCLIAAAPDLIAFAEWVIDQFQGDSGTGESYWDQFSEYRKGVAAVTESKGGAQ